MFIISFNAPFGCRYSIFCTVGGGLWSEAVLLVFRTGFSLVEFEPAGDGSFWVELPPQDPARKVS